MPGQYCAPTGSCELGVLRDGVNGFALNGDAAGDNSGWSVAAAGDINGDGIADLIVGRVGQTLREVRVEKAM